MRQTSDEKTMELISKVKINFILEQPFFATLAMNMEYLIDYTKKTACTNGTYIKFNPLFVNSLPFAENKTLLAHELLHVAFLHHLRRQGRDPYKWNEAADYAINLMLVDFGFKLPKGGLLDRKYEGMSAEQIYRLLRDKPTEGESGECQDTGETGEPGECEDTGEVKAGQWGEVEDAKEKMTEAESNEAESRVKQLLAEACQVARQAGKLPGSVGRAVKELLEPRLPWQQILNRFASELARNDYSWEMPSQRYAHTGLYLPSLRNKEVGRVAFIIDTSGSVNDNVLQEFVSEMQGAMLELHFPVTMLDVDTKVVGEPQELMVGDVVTAKGGGGTDFRPGFEWINKNLFDVKAVFYLTDGFCNSFPDEPDYPTLWVVYDNEDFTPPFGEVIYLNERK